MNGSDIFISHSSKDKATLARNLAKDLENQSYKIWFDSNEIEGSEDWIKEIEQGIDNSVLIVVVWTENAAKSKWVEREIARADDKGKAIIPLVFDDTATSSSILLQRIQFIDFRQGYFVAFQQLISKLNNLLETSERAIDSTEGYSWSSSKRPYYRSRFLEENHYLDRSDSDFAQNSRTLQLIDFTNHNQADKYITIAIIPIPESIDFDFTKFLKLPNIGGDPYQLQYKAPLKENIQYQRFSFAELQSNHSTLTDCLLYRPAPNKPKDFSIGYYLYIRFDENGSIEYADTTKGHYFGNDFGGFRGYGFNLLTILGMVWKSLYLACNVYSWFDYAGKAQLLLNLKNTAQSTLAGFAIDPQGKAQWQSRVRNGFSMPMFDNESNGGVGIATDMNLQFIYDFSVQSLLRTPKVSEDLIVHLSHKLQRAFNWQPADRQYIPNTTEFPWDQFYQNSYARI